MIYYIQEYGMCNYELQFETPLACKQEHVKELESILQSLFNKNDFSFERSDFTVQFDYYVFFI